jgi:hypothetical protein
MEVVPFEISHFDAMKIEERDMCSRQYRDAYDGFSVSGPCFTLMNGKPIFAGGIVINWPGCGHAWMLPSIHVKDHPVSVYKYTEMMIEKYMEENNLHRVQADVQANDKKANNFVVQLGFQFEGLMRAFWTDKSDYFRYARIR